MQIKFDLKLSVYSSGVDIWLLSFKFNFGLVGWPPQPPRERVLKINKIEGFWWSISHWEAKIGLFGAMVNGNIKLSNLFCEMRLLRSLRPQIFQGLEITTGHSRVIKIVEYFDVLKTIIFSEIMKYHFSIFCTFSVGGCWGQHILLLRKLVLIIKMSTSQDFKTTFKYNLTCKFLSLRAQLKKPICPRTPCTTEWQKLSTILQKLSTILQKLSIILQNKKKILSVCSI